MPAALPPSAVQQFIVDGLHVIQPAELSLGDSFHRAVVDQADAAVAAGHGLGGNHHLLRVPLLRELLRDPAVDGALSSLFGEGWQLFQHSALHDGGRLQEATEQVLHKDGPMFGQPRYHRPRWGLLLYYPQPVDAEMGPTKVLPGSQYLFQTYGNPDPGVALPPVHNLTASAAGTVVITSYELFHGATAHRSDRNRQMHKLLIVRTEEPRPLPGGPAAAAAVAPFWESPGFRLRLSASDGPPMLPLRCIWSTVWRWYCGGVHGATHTPAASDGRSALLDVLRDTDSSTKSVSAQREAADQLALDAVLGHVDLSTPDRAATLQVLATSALDHDDELVRLCCSYALGALGEFPSLLANLEVEGRRRLEPDEPDGRCYDGSAASAFTSPSQLDAVYGLAAGALATRRGGSGGAGGGTREALLAKLHDADAPWWARAGVAWALAEIGWTDDGHTEDALQALSPATRDDNEWVARNAAEAIGTAIGGQAQALMPGGGASGPTLRRAGAALAGCVVSDRVVSPWSIGPAPLSAIAAAALARLQRATASAVQPVVDELFLDLNPHTVDAADGESAAAEGAPGPGAVGTDEYVRYWLLRLGGSGRLAVAIPSL